MEPKTFNQQDDKSSSSDDFEIEKQNNLTQIEPNQTIEPQLDIRNFIEQGELIDMIVGQKWISAIVHNLTQTTLQVSIPSRPQELSWFDFDFLSFRKQWIPGIQLHETYRVEVFNKIQGWMEATIIEMLPSQVKIHYNGYKQRYDEVLSFPSDMIMPLGLHTKTYGIGTILKQDPQSLNKFVHRFHTYLQEWSHYAKKKFYYKLESNFPQLLSEQGLMIKDIKGDGNCMFRAVSDQLYGTEEFHNELRMFAIQYIMMEKKFFQNFVVGGDVESYVAYKSQDGIWGDNIELQAFRELYDIPIEVYVYSTTPLKTGLENNPRHQQFYFYLIIDRQEFRTMENLTITRQNPSYKQIKLYWGKFNAEFQKQMFWKKQKQKMRSLKIKSNTIEYVSDEGLSSTRQTTTGLLGKPNLLEEVFNESKRMFEQELKNKFIQCYNSRESQQFVENDADDQLLDVAIQESKNLNDQFEFNQEETIDSQILNGILEESKKNQQIEQDSQLEKMIEESAIEKAIKDSAQTHEKRMYEDPLNNPIIAQVMSMGHFQLDMVLEAYTVVGDDPDMIINYIYEYFM